MINHKKYAPCENASILQRVDEKPFSIGANFLKMEHKIFGRLTINGERYKRDGKHLIVATCECGVVREYGYHQLLRGKIKSCGCYRREFRTITAPHGKSNHPLHTIWDNIKSRCNNPKSTYYNRYGGRGIKMCPQWSNDFKLFYDWAISNGWENGLQIDRKDNDRGYNPENCRLVTSKINNRNRGNNKIDNDGVLYMRSLHKTGDYTLKELSEMFNISISQVSNITTNKHWTLQIN